MSTLAASVSTTRVILRGPNEITAELILHFNFLVVWGIKPEPRQALNYRAIAPVILTLKVHTDVTQIYWITLASPSTPSW